MRSTPQTFMTVGLALLPLLFAPPVGLFTAQAAAIVGADQASGYSGHVLEKVAKKWQAPQYPSEHSVRIRVNIDGDGKILGCWPEQSSSLAQMDKSACAAVHDAGKFDNPPYGLPINVYLTFWTGTPKGNNPYGLNAVDATSQSSDLAQHNSDAAIAAALAAAKAAEAKAALASTGGSAHTAAPIAPAPSAPVLQSTPTKQNTDSAASQKRGHLVGIAGESPTAEEARYARRVAWEIREKMFIPAEIPSGTYSFRMHVRINTKGSIDTAELTEPSSSSLMDKYALRAIKKIKDLTAPPSPRAHDLHLTFRVLRP